MLITPEEYEALIFNNLQPKLTETIRVPFHKSSGYTLASDVHAELNVPSFTNSAMDGFAVRTADFYGEAPYHFRVITDIAAGYSVNSSDNQNADDAQGTDTGTLGIAARIMTGAPVPSWADAVIKVEDTNAPHGASRMPDTVKINILPKVGQNIRRAGEDVHVGDVVLRAGHTLNAYALSTLVSTGHGSVEVRQKPRVAVISTGSELVDAGEALGEGQIPDSNSVLISHLAQEAGAEVVGIFRACDTAENFGATLIKAAAVADIVITSGGVSMGAYDPVKEFGLANGFTFQKVAMQPGKPQGHGLVSDGEHKTCVLCLPGNPVSVAVSFFLFVSPVLDAMLGKTKVSRAVPVKVKAGADWKSASGRRQYLPGRLTSNGSELQITPIHSLGSGSHLVASLAQANALAVVDDETVFVTRGDMVSVYQISDLLRASER
ncbi:molybdopterin molybdotransferase MoeA [Arcanobacterium ihumii]|uniref:molybdopterin molybdotransferase MoeA n=1 Tax=Arcanobacterium ihumii TaxID=2138162 RepID=UPI000F521525|nr:gephyrin-like molybdotransferase Glp [Arcanobacterium ihumii]